MSIEAALGYAGSSMNDGSTSTRGIAGPAGWGASAGAAQDVIDPDFATKRREQARDFAIWMLKEGRSAAKVWEELVASGVDQGVAEEVVKEVLELRRQVDIAAQQAAIEASYYKNQEAQGSFLLGVLFAFFLTGIALIAALVSSSMGSNTKRGIYATAAVKFCLFVVVMIATAR